MTLPVITITPVITPFIKSINNISLILWDYAWNINGGMNSSVYEQFIAMSEDYAEYSPIRFESL